MSTKIWINHESRDGNMVSAAQMQRIAQRNGLTEHAQYAQEQEMAGLTVVMDDLHPGAGWLDAIPQMESMAARVGVVIQHPGNESPVDAFRVAPGHWSRNSFFVYPTAENVVLQPVHLGKGEEGQRRREALETMAAAAGHFWGGKPSIGRWLVAMADKELVNGQWSKLLGRM